MPTISMFFGIVIRMYFAPKEHNPPHIHVYYQDYSASFGIEEGQLQNGEIPLKQTRIVQAWIEIHQEELRADWKLCQNKEQPFKIEPIR